MVLELKLRKIGNSVGQPRGFYAGRVFSRSEWIRACGNERIGRRKTARPRGGYHQRGGLRHLAPQVKLSQSKEIIMATHHDRESKKRKLLGIPESGAEDSSSMK